MQGYNLPIIERKPNGSLIRMTQSQKTEAMKLIRNECCNYSNGNCLLLDNGNECNCPQSLTYSVNCRYFRHVLLKDKSGQALEADIFKDDSTKHCAVCGKAFRAKGNRAKYCTDCAKKVHRKQDAEYNQKRRLKTRQIDSKKPSIYAAFTLEN